MTRDEYLEILATRPATRNQVGAVMGECERLGFAERDRGERLAACAVLLGLDELGSLRDLTMGQAGRLLTALRRVRSRAGLGRREVQPVPLREAIAGALAVMAAARRDISGGARGSGSHAERSEPAAHVSVRAGGCSPAGGCPGGAAGRARSGG